MKKIYFIVLAFIFSININAQCPTFSISAPSGTVVGCNPSTVPLNVVNTSTLSGVTYTWISASQPSSITTSYNGYGNTTYTISGSTPSSTCISIQTISVAQSTLTPSMFVNPISQSLTCNGGCKSFTAVCISGTTNIVGNWFNPDMSPMTGLSSTPMIMCANAKGVYTAQFCSLISGCCTSQTVSVSSNTAIPTISVIVVPGGFTINCTNPCLQMSIASSGTLAPTTYTWIPLANPSASVTPSNGGYTICVPGSYEAQFRDGNFCLATETINVSIDTLRPSPFSSTSLPSSSYTLNCYTPTLVATAFSNPLYPISSYSWTAPGPLPIPGNTVSIGLVNITSSVTPTAYTVSAMAANGCVGKAKVNFYKDIYIPPYTAVFTPSAITCSNPTIAMSPSGPSTVPVTYTFTSPAPTTTANTAGATFSIAGTYTMGYTNMNNGCSVVTTVNVPLNITPPATFAVGPYIIPCLFTSATISAGTNSATGTYSYSWSSPPLAGMSCPGGISCYNSQVNLQGTYTVSILDMSNGCSSTNTVLVIKDANILLGITGNNTICVGETATLTASGATNYTWSTSSNSSSIAVSPTTNATYSVSGASTSGSNTCTGQTTVAVIVNACVGIEELEWNENILIAPNPNNGKFNVIVNAVIEQAELKIVNAIGQEVFRQNIKQGANEINACVLAKGIYHYTITQNKEPVYRGKILIE